MCSVWLYYKVIRKDPAAVWELQLCYHRVYTRLSVPCALGISTNGSGKPFAELRLVQRGFDKLASCCCCASFFWSCLFKAGSLLPHLQRFTFAFFWHRCRFLGPPHSPLALSVPVSEFGTVAQDPGTRWMCGRMQNEWSVEDQGIHEPVQSTRQLDAEMLELWKRRRGEPSLGQHQELWMTGKVDEPDSHFHCISTLFECRFQPQYQNTGRT